MHMEEALPVLEEKNNLKYDAAFGRVERAGLTWPPTASFNSIMLDFRD